MRFLSIKEERKKKLIGASVIIVIALIVIYFLFGGEDNTKHKAVNIPEIKVIKEEESLEQGFKSRFAEDLLSLKNDNEKLQKQLEDLNAKTGLIESENKNLKEEVKNANGLLLSDMRLPPPETVDGSGAISRFPPAPDTKHTPNYASVEENNEPQSASPTVTVMTGLISKGEPIGKIDDKKNEIQNKLKNNSDLVVPAGSFMRSILLSGVIAPTMGQGANQPVPVVIRIADMTTLPNFFKADIKGCFLLAETKGNLATETVSFRLKELACKRGDGTTLERTVDGYVTGENGMEGLSGRVVSKQGAIIARAFAAEFLGGIASAFQEAGNIVTTTGAGLVTTVDPNRALETGLFSGASGAFSRVSEFYMDLADNMVPVIEINAGRRVDAVFIKSVNLSREDDKKGEK